MSKLTDFKNNILRQAEEIKTHESEEFKVIGNCIVNMIKGNKEINISMMKNNGNAIFLIKPDINLKDFRIAMVLMEACISSVIYSLYKAGLVGFEVK